MVLAQLRGNFLRSLGEVFAGLRYPACSLKDREPLPGGTGRMIARDRVRSMPFALAVCAAAVLAAAIMASPAHAQTLVTTTGTFTMRNGDSVTLVQTYLDGVLTTRSEERRVGKGCCSR